MAHDIGKPQRWFWFHGQTRLNLKQYCQCASPSPHPPQLLSLTSSFTPSLPFSLLFFPLCIALILFYCWGPCSKWRGTDCLRQLHLLSPGITIPAKKFSLPIAVYQSQRKLVLFLLESSAYFWINHLPSVGPTEVMCLFPLQRERCALTRRDSTR